ncbi:hypothetical protein D0T12_01590 [Actinomadura spongiicola]|uniref:Uncharacterized protein n=1 Tax=Actinomadura spongiicola TaxID=2303421 RepID=A0A372GNK1_9ACTN|nr:hypothetical protein [Actinomadura spongiicola]RFS86978.1 hypothetical protein D0T12_01590 [Actinomadura spongiicola]
MTQPPEPPPGWTDLQFSLAAYMKLMDEVIVPASRYVRGAEDVDRERYLGSIIERGAARARERRAGSP